jgi:hypothetical protein
MNAQIEKLMKTLDISEEEALEVLESDRRIDKGEKLFELTKEQAKASKDARSIDRKPTVYKFDTSKRPKKENPSKQALIEILTKALSDYGVDSLEVTNPEREFGFSLDGVKYKIVMSCPRK